MNGIAIVTDSTALLPEDVVREYGIRVAPLHLLWDGKVYRDGIDIQPDEFFRRLRKSATLPTTSGAIQAEYLRIFEDLKGKAEGVAVLTLSQDLSAAYNSARLARDMVPDLNVEVVDSRTATAGMGFGVIAAAKAAAAGADLETVAGTARTIFSRTHLLFALDTLEFLRRGGRISWPAAAMASWLKVKPVLSIREGRVEPVARPLTKPKALRCLLDLMAGMCGATPLHVAIMHADAIEEAHKLEESIRARFHYAELVMRPFTPIMGAHTGPGLVGVAFYNE